jgi:hypothetical protein
MAARFKHLFSFRRRRHPPWFSHPSEFCLRAPAFVIAKLEDIFLSVSKA